MKHLICIAVLVFAVACKTTSEGDTVATPSEPETATQPAADPPAEDPEPTSQPSRKGEEDDISKCCDGITFDEVEKFPFSFTVSKDDAAIGKITLDDKHVATFEPADGANAEYLAEVKAVVEAANKEGKVSYKYTNRTPDMHCKCGGQADKGSAQYPGALKHSLYSEYFDVD